MVDEEQLEERRRLLWHLDFFFRPPPTFYDDLERAIERGSAEPRDASIMHHDAENYGGC